MLASDLEPAGVQPGPERRQEGRELARDDRRGHDREQIHVALGLQPLMQEEGEEHHLEPPKSPPTAGQEDDHQQRQRLEGAHRHAGGEEVRALEVDEVADRARPQVVQDRSVEPPSPRVHERRQHHRAEHAGEHERVPADLAIGVGERGHAGNPGEDPGQDEAGEEATVHIRPHQRQEWERPERSRRPAAILEVLEPLGGEREEEVGHDVRTCQRMRDQDEIGEERRPERRHDACADSERSPEDEHGKERVDEHAGRREKREPAPTDEYRARHLEQPAVVDPLVACGREREEVARRNRAGLKDVAAGCEVPPGARVLEEPAGVGEHNHQVKPEHERREGRCEPTAERGRLGRLPARARRHRGSPRMRWAITLRWISEVPPMIVSERE